MSKNMHLYVCIIINFNCNIIAFTAAAISAHQYWKSTDHQQNLFKLFTIILMCPSYWYWLITDCTWKWCQEF